MAQHNAERGVAVLHQDCLHEVETQLLEEEALQRMRSAGSEVLRVHEAVVEVLHPVGVLLQPHGDPHGADHEQWPSACAVGRRLQLGGGLCELGESDVVGADEAVDEAVHRLAAGVVVAVATRAADLASRRGGERACAALDRVQPRRLDEERQDAQAVVCMLVGDPHALQLADGGSGAGRAEQAVELLVGAAPAVEQHVAELWDLQEDRRYSSILGGARGGRSQEHHRRRNVVRRWLPWPLWRRGSTLCWSKPRLQERCRSECTAVNFVCAEASLAQRLQSVDLLEGAELDAGSWCRRVAREQYLANTSRLL
mmetsp:Transcript_13791/g.54542  ORF Transcript_13791/g.54542 Transcript_13791/m.54542 type:complete len:312 (+) Transcript_13791:423-1358(+)